MRPRIDRLSLQTAVAVVTTFVLGARIELRSGVTAGYLLAVLLMPVWLGVLKSYWGARTLLTLGVAALLAGLALMFSASIDHRTPGASVANDWMLLLGIIAGIGIIVWARGVLGTWRVGLWYGLGMMLSAAMSNGIHSSNPWKFALAVPVAVILLSLTLRTGRKILELGALALLAILSVVLDSRSYFATFVLAALLVVWQMRPTTSSRRISRARTGLLIAAVAGVVYFLGTSLLLEGYLGADAQARSVAQVDTAGSLLLGGRPELGATIALLKARPMGFGPGVVANSNEVAIAKQGMASLNYSPDNGYVDNYMFGTKIELHSVFGDLWAKFGIAGLALWLWIALLLVRAVVSAAAFKAGGGAIVIFLSCWNLWNLAFSPLYSSEPTFILGIGLALWVVTPGRDVDRSHDDLSPRARRRVNGVVSTRIGRTRGC